MQQALIDLVWRRANAACEYCHLPQALSLIAFEIDHIVAKKHGELTEDSNLCLACFYCNSYKGPNVAGVTAETRKVVRLFHPRHDTWDDHFEWRGVELRAKTEIGSVTIAVLNINHADCLAMREAFREEGSFPY
jgi:hypothetical protein